MKLDIPVYEFLIDDSKESGVKTISLVEDPAIQSFFVAFDNDKPKPRYVKLESEYEQSILGIALQPELPIYRLDRETGEEYYGVFSVETIKKIVHKFHKELQNNKVNLDHNSENYISAYMYSDYIVDSELQIEDLKSKGITDAKIGSWVTLYKIEDPEVFEKVLNGEFKGLSVEAFLEVFSKRVKNNVLNKKIKSEMKKVNKSLKDKILSIFAEVEKFERMLVPELSFEIEWSEIGEPVNQVKVSENGEETLEPIGKGEFITEAGIIVVDEASNLVEVRDLPAEPAVEEPEAPVSGATSGNTETTIAAAVSGETVNAPTGSTETVTGDTATLGIQKSLLEIVGTTDGDYTVLVKVQNGVITEATAQALIDLMLSKQYNFGDMEKRLKELIPNNRAGSYTINVDVNEDGEYSWGSISTWSALKFHDEKQIQELLNKIEAPIGDPILTPEEPVVDFNKMTAYEKMMHKKGVKAV